jgi:type IV secretion system protein VirD4
VVVAAGEKALLRKAAAVRPSLTRPTAAEVGYALGTSRGVTCWAAVEDSMVLLGPPRSGKGLHVVIPMILDAPGAAITTSTRPDNLAVTMAARAASATRWSHAAPAWSGALDAILSADPRTRDSTWAMVSNTFAALADPAVLDAVSPREHEHFDPAEFLREKGTLYLLGTAVGASATAGIVAAFIEDVAEAARRLAAASPRARLGPPLALLLDEGANYPIPSLPALMSEGGGTGITTMVVLESLAQARSRWGQQDAEAICDSAIVKVVLGGSGNADDLRDLSALIGTREEKHVNASWGYDGKRSFSVSTQDKPILEPGQLRTLQFGNAVLLLRSAPSMMLSLRRWTARKDAATLTAARERLETTIRAASARSHATTGRAHRWGGG